MQNQPTTHPTFLTEIAPYVRGKKLAIYLRGRDKPITGLTVKHIQRRTIIARWNSSTHLIPLDSIAFIRFAPDCDPCRDTAHPLNSCMNSRKPQRPRQYKSDNDQLVPANALQELTHSIAQSITADANTTRLSPAGVRNLTRKLINPED